MFPHSSVGLIHFCNYFRQHPSDAESTGVYYSTNFIAGTLRRGIFTGNRGSTHDNEGLEIDNVGYQEAVDIMPTYHHKDYEEIPENPNHHHHHHQT